MINPRFNDASQKTLVECYRLLRSNDMLGKNKTAYRITVRQLESLIRLSEALARLHLDSEIKESYVKEAFRLLQKSIIFVETEAVQLDEEEEETMLDNSDDQMMNDEIESHLRNQNTIFSSGNYPKMLYFSFE
jgi:DNA replication licensing factor MCM6